MNTVCRFCGAEPLSCKGAYGDEYLVGRCHWVGLLKAMRLAHTELTSGNYVDRALRGQELIEQALEKYGGT